MNNTTAKTITQAFPTLKLPQGIKALDLKCRIERVSIAKASRRVNIYLSANEIISKKDIMTLQTEIKRQLFSNLANEVECIEKFVIDKPIALSRLFASYKDSILFELKMGGELAYQLLKSAKIDFEDRAVPPKMDIKVRFFLPDDSKLNQLRQSLTDIFSKRFLMDTQIIISRQAQELTKTRPDPILIDYEPMTPVIDSDYMPPMNYDAEPVYMSVPKPNKKKPKAEKDFSKFRTKKDPDIIFGRDVEGEITEISNIVDELGAVVISGKLLRKDSRLLRNENTLFMFDITDFTDTISVKVFTKPEQTESLEKGVTVGKSYKIKGIAKYDSYEKDINIGSVTGIKEVAQVSKKRCDSSEFKRVELHCHTKMSSMDGVSSAADLIEQAYDFGHPGIAITDHGGVYAFPEAFHVWEKIIKAQEKKAQEEGASYEPFKLVYGVEGYLADDAPYFNNSDGDMPNAINKSLSGKKRTGLGLDGINTSTDYVTYIRKAKTSHIIILAANEIGRINLYRLMSASHLYYYSKRPRIPKSLLEEYREGLILGSACEAGEVFRAITSGADAKDLKKIAQFYDYLEIQPIANNEFMLFENKKYPNINTKEDLIALNKKVIELADTLNKPVLATCDVHFLNAEDEVYRRILMAGKGFSDADRQAPLYLRTTQEMLEEFSYLEDDLAYEVVVKNPKKILDLIEQIKPVRPDKCPPVIENSDVTLRELCYENAHKKYGTNLPKIVETRLERELNSIIGNGYAVMYIIAQKLVKKSKDDGYLVGSRGSVGSSFAATMSGITEVNPLPPHYYCANCHYSDFYSDAVTKFADKTGFDLPDKNCPDCGNALSKDGFNIPFETFLGFEGDKEPDIDLNFSGEYQSKAHGYTEELFGSGFTYRAGTIGTLKDKTAYGFVKKYLTERNQHKRNAEINRIIAGCVDVLRTTGQHPGGIVVLPSNEEINTFAPVAHPANDINSDIITTQFDYHSIDQNLLKLDILGHDDPTMIRMLQDLTGVDPDTIPMDDPAVMSLFSSTKALGIMPKDIDGCERGTLGIPEFGTGFVIRMLIDAKPKTFSDLVRISGLSHGTDVWVGNAQTLIEEGKASISSAICTRDDIMTYLISMGVESGLAFKIMEKVRKGYGLDPEMEDAMRGAKVPDWYIWSCKKIQYMFPKAHAAAYVMMAWRIAWFKINYPLAYYTAYFSIRAKGFSYAYMCQGEAVFDRAYSDFTKRAKLTKGFDDDAPEDNTDDYSEKEAEGGKENGEAGEASAALSDQERNIFKDMKIVMEMFARGYSFTKLDLMTADIEKFQIIDGKIMPALSSLEGIAQKAAQAIVEAVKDGPFLSKQEFKIRAKANRNLMEIVDKYDLLPGLTESSQMSFL